MTIKDFLKGFIGSLMNMKIKSKSFGVMVGLMIILSIIFTPLVGIPAGLVIGVYLFAQKE